MRLGWTGLHLLRHPVYVLGTALCIFSGPPCSWMGDWATFLDHPASDYFGFEWQMMPVIKKFHFFVPLCIVCWQKFCTTLYVPLFCITLYTGQSYNQSDNLCSSKHRWPRWPFSAPPCMQSTFFQTTVCVWRLCRAVFLATLWRTTLCSSENVPEVTFFHRQHPVHILGDLAALITPPPMCLGWQSRWQQKVKSKVLLI